ncbi:hypothetical protein Pelo_17985 [Pelomyxa schiedti]|nr:hypothetical protein Pelo_17985 [Pelomyxa schiedti]
MQGYHPAVVGVGIGAGTARRCAGRHLPLETGDAILGFDRSNIFGKQSPGAREKRSSPPFHQSPIQCIGEPASREGSVATTAFFGWHYHFADENDNGGPQHSQLDPGQASSAALPNAGLWAPAKPSAQRADGAQQCPVFSLRV